MYCTYVYTCIYIYIIHRYMDRVASRFHPHVLQTCFADILPYMLLLQTMWRATKTFELLVSTSLVNLNFWCRLEATIEAQSKVSGSTLDSSSWRFFMAWFSPYSVLFSAFEMLRIKKEDWTLLHLSLRLQQVLHLEFIENTTEALVALTGHGLRGKSPFVRQR